MPASSGSFQIEAGIIKRIKFSTSPCNQQTKDLFAVYLFVCNFVPKREKSWERVWFDCNEHLCILIDS